jgi:EAL domain-containing protein (putative c-di-GMP-specific phosphodiesterase class I)
VVRKKILVKWIQPDGTMLYPDDFIAQAEEEALLAPLTFNMIEQAFRNYKIWQTLIPTFAISTNLSTISLHNFQLPAQLCQLVEKCEINDQMSRLEMTESQIILELRLRLGLKGVKLSIDDFSTAYSSFLKLEQLPFTEFKVDKNFVHGVKTQESKIAILAYCAGLSKKSTLNIVAEEVDNIYDLDSAAMAHCDLVQGCLYSRPVDNVHISPRLQNDASTL